ncbi:hypothetical protein ACP70R_004627 [Stipagrostis hirtigluma subsp. patula]
MSSQRKPSGSDFRPKSRMSTRSKVANGLSMTKREGRFRSDRMKKIHKEVRKQAIYMTRVVQNRNNKKARMQSGKEIGVSNVNDQRDNIVSRHAGKDPLKYAMPVKKTNVPLANSANKSKHSVALISKSAYQPSTSMLDNGTTPLIDTKSSEPSRSRDVLPLEKLVNHASFRSEDGLNTTFGHPKQSHLLKVNEGIVNRSNTVGSSCQTHLTKLSRKTQNVDTSYHDDDALVSRSKGRGNPIRGEVNHVRKYNNEILKSLKAKDVLEGSNVPMASETLAWDGMDPNEDKGTQDEVMIRKEEIESHTNEVHAMCEDKEEHIVKADGDTRHSSLLNGDQPRQDLEKNSGNNYSTLFHQDFLRHQRDKASCIEDAILSSKDVAPSEFTNMGSMSHQIDPTDKPTECDDKLNDGKSKRRKEPLPEQKAKSHDDDSEEIVHQKNLTRRPIKRRCILANDDDVVGGCDQNLVAIQDGTIGSTQVSISKDCFMQQNNCCTTIDEPSGCANRKNDEMSERRKEPLVEEKFDTRDDNSEVLQQKNLTLRPVKRRYILTNDDDEVDGDDQIPMGIEDGTLRLTQQAAIMEDRVIWRSNCCSKPMDKPIWSGSFIVSGKEYMSLGGHLSTKSCEKVWKLSRLLPQVVEVTKASRLANWPEIWKTTKPTGDNIGLYFFPQNMRHDEELDQLVNEVKDNDLILRAVTGGAEILIFHSILLPERYQTFQAKHYLWGVFKPRRDKCAIYAEPLYDTGRLAQEEENEKQNVLNQQNELQCEEPGQELTLMKSVEPLENQLSSAKSTQQVRACSVQGSTIAPEEGRLGDASRHVVSITEATVVATDAANVPAEAIAVATDADNIPLEKTTADATDAAVVLAKATSIANDADTVHTNQAWVNTSIGDTPGSMFTIVGRQTPKLEKKLEQFIQDLKHDDAFIAFVQGEAVVAGPWPSNIATTNPPCSSKGEA